AQSSDTWHWQLDPVRGYTVRGAYHLLTSHEFVSLYAVEDLIGTNRFP
ncbi:hypothetical protein A2U01_0116476, partial [Trifolium medium]|nr:hypothetical protein [Trifolium medium]